MESKCSIIKAHRDIKNLLEYGKNEYRLCGDNEQLFTPELLDALECAELCLGTIDQIRFERDVAIKQLHEPGYELGQKIDKAPMIIRYKFVGDREILEHLRLDDALKPEYKDFIEYIDISVMLPKDYVKIPLSMDEARANKQTLVSDKEYDEEIER